HPLRSPWTLYFDSPKSKTLSPTISSSVSWKGSNLRKVMTVDSVEEFWGLYNNVVSPSELPVKANYYFFKNGILPAWEDAENNQGGVWSVQLSRVKSRDSIDRLWLYSLLSAIGNTFEATSTINVSGSQSVSPISDLVNGVVISVRADFYRIGVWTREAHDDSVQDLNPRDENTIEPRLLSIGQHFKVSILGYGIDEKIDAVGIETGVTFERHRKGDKKAKKNKIVL
ncbi:hypothetical protein I204_08544, partial [Kwoniella mangroviensis CBS 8886]